jgi:peptidoglycan biosynthesis protein MviN/MurJ (putative lipid II flippase)
MYSLELIKQLLIITIAGCSLKVIFNFILVCYLKQDGLALSSSLSYFFFFGTSLLLIVNRLQFNIQKIFIQRLLLLLINSFLAYILSLLLCWCIFQFYPYNFIQNIVQLVFFITIYLVNSYYYDKNYINIFVNLIDSTKNELKSTYE